MNLQDIQLSMVVIAEDLILEILQQEAQDIKQATATARAMVTKYGMSADVGPINYNNDDNDVFLGKDLAHDRGYGENTATQIDSEVKRIITECYAEAERILKENIDILHKSAEILLEKEKIGRDEFEALFPEGIAPEKEGRGVAVEETD